MKKIFRYTTRFLLALLVLFVAAWLFLWGYVHFNKAGIISKVKAQINQQVKGKVDIKDVEVDLFSTFPNISIRLTGVSIRDSLWAQHHHDFFKAGKVLTRLKLFSLFSGKPAIGKVIVEDAAIYLYTDSTGYTNLVKAGAPISGKRKESAIPDFLFRRTRFTMDNLSRHKLHDIEVKEMECIPEQTKSGLELNIDLDAIVHSLAFNTEKGSYIKEKQVTGDFTLLINPAKEIILDDVELKIDKHPVRFSGTFFTGVAEPNFKLKIEAKKIKFAEAVTMLNGAIQPKLGVAVIEEPVSITAELEGLMAYRSIPLVNVNMVVNKSVIQTPAGNFDDCSFTGSFTNGVDKAQPRLDENSRIRIIGLQAQWSGIPLTSKSIEITNLINPLLDCDLQSTFQLANLNELTGSNSLQFLQGSGEMNIRYKGSLSKKDSVYPTVNGSIQFKNAELVYIPRNLNFKNCSGAISFKDQDVFIEHFRAQGGGTSLLMEGSVKNLVTLINNNPERLELDWNISTPNLNVNDFVNYLGNRSGGTTGKASSKVKFAGVSSKIDRMLELGTAQLNINAARVVYKKFVASNVSANISLLQNKVVLNKAQLSHAGGTMTVNGSLTDGPKSNPLSLNATLTNVDIPGIFYAFSNFNQDAITDQNMKGRISAQVQVKGAVNNKAANMVSDLDGTVKFSIKNAELNNFEPLQKVSETIFKKRDFSNVRFAELKNTLDIHGSAININPMEINSSVFTMFVQGVYDTKKGTDLDLRVPFRNLNKMDGDRKMINSGKIGSNVRLRAKTSDDGKLKVKLVLFGKKDE